MTVSLTIDAPPAGPEGALVDPEDEAGSRGTPGETTMTSAVYDFNIK